MLKLNDLRDMLEHRLALLEENRFDKDDAFAYYYDYGRRRGHSEGLSEALEVLEDFISGDEGSGND